MAKVERRDRLIRRMKAMRDAPRKYISEEIAAGANELSDAVRSSARGRRMKASVGWAWGAAPAETGVRSSSRAEELSIKGAQQLAATVFAGNRTAFWARWDEFGTRPHRIGGLFKGAKHPGTPARPFFFPNFRLRRKRLLGRISRGARRGIQEAIRRS
jgi:hypothetical protein